jgi:2-hydroxychromene-2-carboxylate isomerase
VAQIWLLGCGAAPDATAAADQAVDQDEDAPVHAELIVFILARCPYCASFMRAILPIKQRVGPALDIGIGYIGTVDEIGEADFAHGDAEVAAAEIQICVGLTSEEREWIDFLVCEYEGDAWQRMPDGWTECAERAGIDIVDVTECVDSGEGRDKLGLAIAAAAASGIEAAPTAILDGRLYLGGRNPDAFMGHFCYLSGRPETRPKACDDVEPPPAVSAVLLVDRRCDDPMACDVSREIGFLQMLVPTLEIEEVDFSSDRGRALHVRVVEAGGPRHLPLLVLDSGLAGHPAALEQMGEYLLEIGDEFLMPLGEGWDPLAEICDNKVDDDDDDDVDCDDDDCSATLPCREEQPGRIDLFMMSQCPFATELIPSLDHFLDHFRRDPRKVDLRLQFIGHVTGGNLRSMHGEAEVAENLRMVCAQKLYRAKYKFMDYVKCRAADYESTDWQSCVPKGMNADEIRACAEGDQGRDLLRQSFGVAAAMGIRGSPTWILNNRFEVEARSAAGLTEAFCEHNDPSACNKEIAPEPDAPSSASNDKCK